MALVQFSTGFVDMVGIDAFCDLFPGFEITKKDDLNGICIMRVRLPGMPDGDMPYTVLLETQRDGTEKIKTFEPEYEGFGLWSYPRFVLN